jgi:hypothetical protein
MALINGNLEHLQQPKFSTNHSKKSTVKEAEGVSLK